MCDEDSIKCENWKICLNEHQSLPCPFLSPPTTFPCTFMHAFVITVIIIPHLILFPSLLPIYYNISWVLIQIISLLPTHSLHFSLIIPFSCQFSTEYFTYKFSEIGGKSWSEKKSKKNLQYKNLTYFPKKFFYAFTFTRVCRKMG